MNLISLFVTAVLTENVVLSKFLGLCPFMGSSRKEKTALGMGLAVMSVVLCSSLFTYFIYHYLLVPNDAEYLTTLFFIFVIACFVKLAELIIRRISKPLHQSLGIYLPLITTNCAVLGITLLNVRSDFSFLEMLVYSIGSSFGFALILYIFSTLREKMETSPIPNCLKGTPIAFFTVSIMALLFGRFVGL
jgi:electron transport complex protein RnfA